MVSLLAISYRLNLFSPGNSKKPTQSEEYIECWLWRQNSTFEFCLYFWHSILYFYNLYLHLQLNIQVFNFSTPVSTLQFEVFNIQVYAIQHPSLRNSTFNFRKCTFSISNRKPVNHIQCGLSKLYHGKFRLSRGQQRQVTLPQTVAFTTCFLQHDGR